MGQEHAQRPAGLSSSAPKIRPASGCTRSSGNVAALTSERLDAFRIAVAGDRHLARVPGADRLERLLVLAIGEISGGALIRAGAVRRVLAHA